MQNWNRVLYVNRGIETVIYKILSVREKVYNVAILSLHIVERHVYKAHIILEEGQVRLLYILKDFAHFEPPLG